MPHAELSGLRLYYERAGGGRPELLFVSGWCCDHSAFQPQFEHFARDGEEVPADIASIPKPVLGYFGYMDYVMDVPLIEEVARLRPDWHYVKDILIPKLEAKRTAAAKK